MRAWMSHAERRRVDATIARKAMAEQDIDWTACVNPEYPDCAHDIEDHNAVRGCELCECKRYEQRMPE